MVIYRLTNDLGTEMQNWCKEKVEYYYAEWQKAIKNNDKVNISIMMNEYTNYSELYDFYVNKTNKAGITHE